VNDNEFVHYEAHGNRLVHVVLNRPPANALSMQVVDELDDVIDRLLSSEVQLVVIRSTSAMFMAGADLNMINAGWDDVRSLVTRTQRMMNRWEALPMMTMAVINGHAAGAGCELSLTCDFRVMARSGPRIGLPEVLRGLLPGAGGTQRMARLIGKGRALDLCLRGRLIQADEAERLGLITEAVDAEQLDARVAELSEELLLLPRLSTQAIKRCIVQGLDVSLAEGLQIEEKEMTALGSSSDTREGVRAFLEKREPNYTGH
jgi:enoyl-CoA hydratase/carnithine racemase